jgi:hypothetical protein
MGPLLLRVGGALLPAVAPGVSRAATSAAPVLAPALRQLHSGRLSSTWEEVRFGGPRACLGLCCGSGGAIGTCCGQMCAAHAASAPTAAQLCTPHRPRDHAWQPAPGARDPACAAPYALPPCPAHTGAARGAVKPREAARDCGHPHKPLHHGACWRRRRGWLLCVHLLAQQRWGSATAWHARTQPSGTAAGCAASCAHTRPARPTFAPFATPCVRPLIVVPRAGPDGSPAAPLQRAAAHL